MIKNKKQILNIRWDKPTLFEVAKAWRIKMRKKYLQASDKSPWWPFRSEWNQNIKNYINDFCDGNHRFSPMYQYRFKDDVVRCWSQDDRLIMHFIFKTLPPTFKYVISPLCQHLSGPSVIKKITKQISAALANTHYNYVMRVDIKSFYASIDHKILLTQVKENFNDPIILKYLEDIITIAVDDGEKIFLPNKGIPLQSSLSPFFGALYLCYLSWWASWWHSVTGLGVDDVVYRWVVFADGTQPFVWHGWVLLDKLWHRSLRAHAPFKTFP
jgi:RNA-directed DNA polymerase